VVLLRNVQSKNRLPVAQLQDEKRAEQLATGYDICSCTCLSGTFCPLGVKDKKLYA